MASIRMGLSGDAAGRALLQIGMLPFILGYLLLYATIVHARRALRLALGHRFS